MNEFHRQMSSRSWSRFRNGLDGNWLLRPKLDRSSCSHGSILSLWIMCSLEVKKTLDMSVLSPICPVPHRRGSWNTVLSPQSSRYLHWSTVWSIENGLGDLRIFVHSRAEASLHSLIGPRCFVRCRQFCWHHHGLRIVLSNKFPCTFWTTRDSPGQFVDYVWYCSVDTELIDGNDCAKNHFGCVVVTTEMFWQCVLFPLLFEISSFQSTGSTECGMSTFTEVDHHVLSDTIPFGLHVWVPYHFFSDPGPRNEQCPCAYLLVFCYGFGIRSTQFFVLSTQCRCTLTWRWFILGIAQVHNVFQSSCSGSRRESAMQWILGNFPLELHQLPYDPILDIGMNSKTNRFSLSMRLRDFHWFCPCRILSRKNRTARSINKVVLFQELCCQSITDIPWISFWSLTNFFVTSNNCFTVRCDWFLVECKFSK